MIIIPHGASTKPASKRDEAKGLLVMAIVALLIAVFVFVQSPNSRTRPPLAAGWGALAFALLFGLIGGVALLRSEGADDAASPDNNPTKEQ